MAGDDPFSSGDDNDRTIIVPNPGGRRPPPEQHVPPQQPATGGYQSSPAAPPPPAAVATDVNVDGRNPLLTAATVAFLLAGKLRMTMQAPDVRAVRERVVNEVREFERRCQALGVSREDIVVARYSLCTLLDESVLNTPWGSSSDWSNSTLLSVFHDQTWGGEQFFTLLQQKMAAPAANLNVLEFMYTCLATGLKGKYRVLERGENQLAQIRAEVFSLIRTQRGEPDPSLSPHWRGVEDTRNPIARYVPLWVILAFSAGLLFFIWLGYFSLLKTDADGVFEDLNAIGRVTMERPPIAVDKVVQVPTKPDLPWLRDLLKDDIARKAVKVEEDEQSAVVTLRYTDLFASGRASINAAYHPLIERIGAALTKVPGPILVTGHTDNVPIKSARFQSNWDLSRQRALAVQRILQDVSGLKGRLRAEGKADTEPLVPNDSRTNRAINRRVEIQLVKGAGI